jgi:hypothetical protein
MTTCRGEDAWRDPAALDAAGSTLLREQRAMA